MALPVFIGALGSGEHQAGIPHGVEGIPDTVLLAYAQAAMRLEEERPGCTGMTWPVLAGIGKVESGHADGSEVSSSGRVNPLILGPRLDGSGAGGNTTPHGDSDEGAWDGDDGFDRAVGPMQFIPTTWASHGLDASGDDVADPHNVFDAAWSAAVYLCVSDPEASDVDFTDEDDLEAALLRYNGSASYVRKVRAHIDEYTELAAQTAPLLVGGSGAGSEQGRAAAEWALAQVGKPYLWGGTGPHAFDCSGLTMQAWAAAGVSIPRVTTDQVAAGVRVGLDELQPGDLLFYDTGSGASPSHVTMYVGEGQMVNAPRTGTAIRVEPVDGDYYSSRFVAAVRPG
ncbi:bifunctional lytic transglycosylase/C40 family peptidase [Nocardiopsis sp. HUAS JQ3]|uniref:C40 family peptidase n=1 Tax=Nocardiopsis sp. HUAS JQ3 TaxID=3061629 RepID=UPI0023A9E90E|nr:bifunctional lytic transglycosylase/C40 family peptidase [Nocardiopsis sp. HUAS JQ3]WDZ90580.1 bifunctional lytic transglycosylase/C40 family peptidase [Nocardiopsis sp. HUAS JQ3]